MSGAAWLSIITGSTTPNPLNRKPNYKNVKSLLQVARLGWRTTRALRRDRNAEVWPWAEEGVVVLSRVQLSMLLEGIDWRMPRRTWRPELAG